MLLLVVRWGTGCRVHGSAKVAEDGAWGVCLHFLPVSSKLVSTRREGYACRCVCVAVISSLYCPSKCFLS